MFEGRDVAAMVFPCGVPGNHLGNRFRENHDSDAVSASGNGMLHLVNVLFS